jgi:hypothetical protein
MLPTTEILLNTLRPGRPGLPMQALRAIVPGPKSALVEALDELQANGDIAERAGVYVRVTGRVARYRARAEYAGHIRREYYALPEHHDVLKVTLKTLQDGAQ